MMRHSLLLASFFLLSCIGLRAQKIVLIDMDYITENIPAYQQANTQLEQLSRQYQQEIDGKGKEAETMYKEYQTSASSLSATARNKKEEAIVAKEKEIAELRKAYFGPEGELSKKQEELIAPIHDEIYQAVKQVAQQSGYDIVVDRASAQSIIFAQPRIDISNLVLAKLGYIK